MTRQFCKANINTDKPKEKVKGLQCYYTGSQGERQGPQEGTFYPGYFAVHYSG